MDPLALIDFLGFSVGEVERALLILARLTGLFLSAPFFSRAAGPSRIKAALLLALTVVIFPLVAPWSGENKSQVPAMFAAAITETIIGATMGMLVHWVLVSVQVAGNIIGFQMGLSMAMVMDPTSGIQEGVLSNLLYLTVLVLFITVGGHFLLLEAVTRSFQALPLGSGLPHAGNALESALKALAAMFNLALLISAPILVATTLLYIGLGLINRASPQIQVFFLSMPMAQMMGFIILGLTMALFGRVMLREIDTFFTFAFHSIGFK
ncbi:MAG: flagellar biosynthetic protein FliR [Magnetococcales bacterium]|nr:flagellar biosynthetic protein FliR [Magnetococcales bacterium]